MHQIDDEARAIVAFLDGLPLGQTKVSLREVEKAIGSKLSPSAFRYARALALSDRPKWALHGLALIRV
jgi:hypothetical protein